MQYTHSTAPNRRLVDLVTQRVVKGGASSDHVAPYRVDELAEIAAHASEREVAAQKVERRVRKSAAACLLRSRIGQVFDGIITGVSEKGTYLRITNPPAEGKITEGFRGLRVGDRVRATLQAADVERGYIDFLV
jgi:exoribonuclease-2